VTIARQPCDNFETTNFIYRTKAVKRDTWRTFGCVSFLGMLRSATGNAFNFQAAQLATGEKEIRDALDKLDREPVTGS
jgi:hypothetical protein